MKISIALCTYNGERHLLEQLKSIESQTRKPDELIVCDDKSTDKTLDILYCFKKTCPFPMQIHENESKLGSTRNFEKVIQLCGGVIIALSDQDDIWKPDKLEKIAAEFEKGPDIGYVFSDAELVDERAAPLRRRLWAMLGFQGARYRHYANGDQFSCLLRRNIVTGATMAFRASLRDLVLPFPCNTTWLHDGWIALIASAAGKMGRPVPEPLLLYRQHAEQQVGAAPRMRISKAFNLVHVCAVLKLNLEQLCAREAESYPFLRERLAVIEATTGASTRTAVAILEKRTIAPMIARLYGKWFPPGRNPRNRNMPPRSKNKKTDCTIAMDAPSGRERTALRTCAVIVTYGDRFPLLSSVVDALRGQGICSIIVIDNHSNGGSRDRLKQLETDLNGLMTVVYLEENTGSAGGFKTGLEKARSLAECDFIWLLDDDNRPEPGALAVLQQFWNDTVRPGGEALACLVSSRRTMQAFRDYALGKETVFNPILADRNAFLGLNILRPVNIAKRIRTVLVRKKPGTPPGELPDALPLPFAPYGGMFFHTSLLDTIGYPDHRLYLYGDDIEYSYRIVRAGGSIMLVLNSRVDDLEEERRSPDPSGDLARLYYRARNLTFFRKQLIDRPFVYAVNKALFWPVIVCGGGILAALWKKRQAEIRVYLAAVRDGLRGNLGKKVSIP